MRRVLLITCLLCACPLLHAADDFQNISLDAILGPERWVEFKRAFEALANEPQNERAFSEYSAILNETKSANKVAPYLEKLIEASPEDNALRYILGLTYKELLASPGQAKEQFEIILKKENAIHLFAHYQLANILAREGAKGFDGAVENYRQAADAVSGKMQHAGLHTRIVKQLGNLYYENRAANSKFQELAIQWWNQMVAEKSGREFDLQTYEDLALIFRSHDLWSNVAQTYEHYLKQDLHDDNVVHSRLLVKLGEAYEKQNDYSKAIERYQESAAMLDANHWQRRELERRIFKCHQQAGSADTYSKSLQDQTRGNADRLTALQVYGRTLEQSGNIGGAIEALEEARKLAPRSAPVLNALAAMYRRQNRMDRLENVLKSQIEIAPENFGGYVELAEACIVQGKTDEAQNVLKELENTKSRLPEKQLQLARAYRRFKLNGAAVEAFNKLIENNEASTEQRLEYCDLCLSTPGQEGRAIAEQRKLCSEGVLNAAGYVQLAKLFRAAPRNDSVKAEAKFNPDEVAAEILSKGAEHEKKDSQSGMFLLNLERSDLYQKLGRGHHGEAISFTMQALLHAPSLYFKKILNDRIVTLLWSYGHREKLIYGPDEEKSSTAFGGNNGEGVAPWIEWLNVQANNSEDATDWWILLGQIHESVQVNAVLPSIKKKDGAQSGPRTVQTSLRNARQYYQRVIDGEFQNVDAHTALARVLADPSIDEYENAVMEMETLSALNPAAKWDAVLAVGDVLANAGDKEKALNRWQEVTEQALGEPSLSYRVGMRMFRLGNARDALELVGQSCAINPGTFKYRVTLGRMQLKAAVASADDNQLKAALEQTSAAMQLCKNYPELASFGNDVKRDLFNVQLELARREFLNQEYEAARQRFEECGRLYGKGIAAVYGRNSAEDRLNPDSAGADCQVQIARCLEALGKTAEAKAQYDAIFRANPKLLCWLWPGVRVAGPQFMKLHDRVRRTAAPAASPAAANPKNVQIKTVLLNNAIHSLSADRDNSLRVGTESHNYTIDPRSGGILKKDQNSDPVNRQHSVAIRVTGNSAVYLGDNKLNFYDGPRQATGWSVPIDPLKDGYIRVIRASGDVVITCGNKWIRAYALKDGKNLWNQECSWREIEVKDGKMALLRAAESGDSELATVDLQTGRTIATLALPSGSMCLRPIIAQDCVLLMDPLIGTLQILDFNSLQRKGVYFAGVSPEIEPCVIGNTVYIYYQKQQALNVIAFDLDQFVVRFNAPVSDKGDESKAAGAPARVSRVLADFHSLPPCRWKNCLLHFDSLNSRVLGVNCDTGTTTVVAELPGSPQLKCWVLVGNVLACADQAGVLHLIALEGGQDGTSAQLTEPKAQP